MELLDLINNLDTKSKIFGFVIILLVLDRVGALNKLYGAISKLYHDFVSKVKDQEEKDNLLSELRFESEAQKEATTASQNWARESRFFSILENLIKDDLAKISATLDRVIEKDIEQTKILVELKDSNSLLATRIVYLSDTIRELTDMISNKVER